jgi:hypothetical protein
MQLVGQNVFRVKGASQGLALVPVQGHGWEEAVRRETWSPVYGQKAALTVLNFGTIADVPAEFALMLATLEEVGHGARSFARIGSQEADSAVRAYQYAGEAGEYSFFFAEPRKPWRQSSVSSDAEFLCWGRSPGGSLQRLILCNGSYTKIEGGPQLRCRQAVRWCELVVEAGSRTVRSSDPEAVEATPGDVGCQQAELNGVGG